MRRSLAETQRAFARALGDPDLPVPEGVTGLQGSQAKCRFAIYRNNVAVSLIDALADSFPVTAALVGEEFFRAMAGEYARTNKPTSPILSLYGEEFPRFIASFAPANGVPYLADVARIEVAWTRAYHAADAAPCNVSVLSGLGERIVDARATFLPSTLLVTSEFPAGSIWLSHKTGEAAAPSEWEPEAVLISRPVMEVEAVVLTGARRVFVSALATGGTVAEAAGAAFSLDGAFNPGSALVDLVNTGCVQNFEERKET